MAKTKRTIAAKGKVSMIWRKRAAVFFLFIMFLSLGVWHLFSEPLDVDSPSENLEPHSHWSVPRASYRHGWTNYYQNWSEGGSEDFPRIWKPMLAAPKMRTPGQAFYARVEYHGEHDDWDAYITPSILDSPRGLNRYSL
ncbi:MAG: hypothetical protein QCI38_05430, partial [Candidatus Thermoplasmatota archaeon]|nr:hypothetical protein [Candidatus Thermoplasmatota archaeon]